MTFKVISRMNEVVRVTPRSSRPGINIGGPQTLPGAAFDAHAYPLEMSGREKNEDGSVSAPQDMLVLHMLEDARINTDAVVEYRGQQYAIVGLARTGTYGGGALSGPVDTLRLECKVVNT